MRFARHATVSLILLGTCILRARADDHAVAPFLSNDTFAVVHLDAASLPAGDSTDTLKLLPLLPEEAQSRLMGLMMVNEVVKRFQDAGGQGIYLVAGLADVHLNGGPVLIATAAPGKRPEPLAQMFQELIQNFRDDKNPAALHPLANKLSVRRHGDVVLVGMSETVKRYDLVVPGERPDIVEPLTRLSGEGAVMAGVFSPGADFRRVVRELWPELPPPLTPLRGELADRWQRLEFAVNAPPDAKPRMALQATDADAAQTFVDLYRALPLAARQLDIGEHRHELARYLDMFVGLASPQLEANRVTLNLSTAEDEMAQLREVLSDIIGMGQRATQNRQRTERFKNMSLAMLNYADVNKHLPPAAIRDQDGRPLLSWRVAILPYLDRDTADLYKQFHLDEPWDSPHNRALVDKMPDVFADPDPETRGLAGTGKTTFQAPVGASTAFFNNEGVQFREITDGTSMTILLVEVPPQQAVEWTRPADWVVDMQNPRRGIERTDRDRFTTAFVDGSVHIIPTNIDQEHWRALLSRGGKEFVERP